MEQERARIKKMLNDGKITKEDAEKLLDALPHPKKDNGKHHGKGMRPAIIISFIALIAVLSLCYYFFSSGSKPSVSKVPEISPIQPLNNIDRTPLEPQPVGQQSIHPEKHYSLMEIPENSIAGQGEMLLISQGKKLALPLIGTNVTGKVNGFLARVTVEQKFINPGDSTVEAIYVFPLPENSAVDSMVMTIGAKRIKGIIKERGEARAIYEQARREGRTASLLEQERPNIFTQSVANILRGDTILVTISYVQELKFRKGKYYFNFPMVVGPRYIPGTPHHPEKRGTEPPTDQVTDAEKITPPILPQDFRSGNEISLSLSINAGTPVKELESPSHKIKVTVDGSTNMVALQESDRIPNKDFMLEYTVSGNEINNVVLTHRSGNQEGFFQLLMIPKRVIEKDVFPRELVFVVDNSGSMGGFPIEKCKEVMRLCLSKMRKNDLFNVIKFSGSTGILWKQSEKATDENVKSALDYVDQMRGGGGTEMLSAINSIFDLPKTEGRRRLVLFLTDGFIGNEGAVLATVRQRLEDSRVFSLGVGSSVNHYLIEGLAYVGHGESITIRQDGNAEKATEDFYELIDAPALTDISLEWQGLEVQDQQPAQLPDLFFGQPLVVTAKYKNAGKGTLRITGKLAGNKNYDKSIRVELPEKNNDNALLATLWARKKIGEIQLLESKVFGANAYTTEEVKEKVLKLGLAYKIMTNFTSFVAVDDAVRNKSGKWVSVEQPVDLPEGVSPNSQPAYRFGRVTQKGLLPMPGVTDYVPGSGVHKQLKTSGLSGMGRMGTARARFAPGYAGAGEGGGGMDDLLDELGSGGSAAKKSESLTRRATVEISSSTESLTSNDTLAGRSPDEIRRVIMQHIGGLRAEYNKRLRSLPNLKGSILIRLSIDPSGRVINCILISSTLNDKILEMGVISRIKSWMFSACSTCGTATLNYPFSFSQQ